MRVDSQKLAIRASSKILVEYSPCPVEAILSAVIAVVTRFRTRKSAKPESTQCVPKKNMNCHGVPCPHKQATHLIPPNPSSKESPWLTSYFPEEYTVCHAGTTQPESAKFATHPKICHLYKPKAAAQKCSGLNKTKLAFDSSCKSIHVESLHDDEKY